MPRSVSSVSLAGCWLDAGLDDSQDNCGPLEETHYFLLE